MDDLGLFRQRLRSHYFDLTRQWEDLPRGSAAWFDCERAIHATGRLYATLYGEAVAPVHSAGESRKPATG